MSVALRVPVADASGEIVKTRFLEFLQTYREDVDEGATNQQRLAVDYMLQMATMMQNNKSTVYVNFRHVLDADHELAEAIEIEYYRFEPYLRNAVQECIAKDNQHYVMDVDRGQREFFVSFYNMSRVERIRGMRTDKIGRLLSMSGTVTRSSEVRPELLYGAFTCTKCGTVHPSVEQQYQYTEPQVCKNPQCAKGEFHLNLTQCAFVDWQMLKVQENADEIPAGRSTPHTSLSYHRQGNTRRALTMRSYCFLPLICHNTKPPLIYLPSHPLSILNTQYSILNIHDTPSHSLSIQMPVTGSMPRTMEVICRNEVVEMAKAGDKVVFTGTVAVVPDTTGMATIGDSTQGNCCLFNYSVPIYTYSPFSRSHLFLY